MKAKMNSNINEQIEYINNNPIHVAIYPLTKGIDNALMKFFDDKNIDIDVRFIIKTVSLHAFAKTCRKIQVKYIPKKIAAMIIQSEHVSNTMASYITYLLGDTEEFIFDCLKDIYPQYYRQLKHDEDTEIYDETIYKLIFHKYINLVIDYYYMVLVELYR
jgi:hypothetical protein